MSGLDNTKSPFSMENTSQSFTKQELNTVPEFDSKVVPN